MLLLMPQPIPTIALSERETPTAAMIARFEINGAVPGLVVNGRLICDLATVDRLSPVVQLSSSVAPLSRDFAAGFALSLPEYDGYFTWSLLVALTQDGKVEAIQPGKRNKKYRLT